MLNKKKVDVNNPYHAPAADLSRFPEHAAPYVPAFFAWRGRLGRARYVAYLAGTMLLAAPLMFALTVLIDATVSQDALLVTFVPVLTAVLATLAWALVAARRLNDLDRSGWFALLGIVPFVNVVFGLWLLFGQGDSGANTYGPPSCANSTGVMVACVTALVFATAFTLEAGIKAFGVYKAAQLGFSGNVPAAGVQAPR